MPRPNDVSVRSYHSCAKRSGRMAGGFFWRPCNVTHTSAGAGASGWLTAAHPRARSSGHAYHQRTKKRHIDHVHAKDCLPWCRAPRAAISCATLVITSSVRLLRKRGRLSATASHPSGAYDLLRFPRTPRQLRQFQSGTSVILVHVATPMTMLAGVKRFSLAWTGKVMLRTGIQGS
jgi:hypothetical protein